MQVALHRADALSSVLELDKNLTVLRADDAAGLMFGLPSSALLRMQFTRCGETQMAAHIQPA